MILLSGASFETNGVTVQSPRAITVTCEADDQTTIPATVARLSGAAAHLALNYKLNNEPGKWFSATDQLERLLSMQLSSPENLGVSILIDELDVQRGQQGIGQTVADDIVDYAFGDTAHRPPAVIR